MEDADLKKKESWWDFIRFAIIATAIVVPIRIFIAQPFIVSGASMVPTFEDKNYLIIDEISYRFEEPKRGDVIVFRFPLERKKFLIKRIIGLPSETITIKDDEVTIINEKNPEGFALKQTNIKTSGRKAEQSMSLGSQEYFVLGDNRDESADSRLWGPLNRGNITGRPLLRLFPLNKIELFPGQWETQKEDIADKN